MSVVTLSFWDIEINHTPLDDIDPTIREYVENVSVELNEKELDVCRITLQFHPSLADSIVLFAKEGDEIDVYMGWEGQPTGFEHVFDGRVKTVQPFFGNTLMLTIEAFEDLFLLDFCEEELEAEASPTTAIREMVDDTVEKAEEFVDELFDTGETQEGYATVKHVLESIQARYLQLIQEIRVDEPDYALEKKLVKGKGIKDYQFLIELAYKFNRAVSLKDGVLSFVEKRQKIKEPFVYFPALATVSPTYYPNYIQQVQFRTTLKNLVDKVEVISATRVGQGVLMTSQEAEDVVQGKTRTLTIHFETLERNKALYDQWYAEGVITKERHDELVSTKYEAEKERIQAYYDAFVQDIDTSRKYYYEILSELPTGERIKFLTNHAITSEDNAKKYAQEYLKAHSRKFVEGSMYLISGNNLLRTWQVLDVMVMHCGDYGVRFSGEYNISQVTMSNGKYGFQTSATLDRNFIIER